jgi:hypothetical protein
MREVFNGCWALYNAVVYPILKLIQSGFVCGCESLLRRMKRSGLVTKLSLPVLRYRCICVETLVYSQTSKRNQDNSLGAVFVRNPFPHRYTSAMFDHSRRQNDVGTGRS